MNDQHLKKIFVAHRVDVPDDGFSERIVRQLPARKSMLPQIVMAACIVAGLALTLAIQGILPLIEQVNSLIMSISQMQIPSPGAVITYAGILASLGVIGYSVMQAE